MKVLKAIGILIFLNLFLLLGQAKAQTSVSGPIDQDTTWAEANTPYVVTGDVTVLEGVTLTLKPVAMLKFSNASNGMLCP